MFKAIYNKLFKDMPGGIPYIVGNEAAERFSFYGMRGILFVFMTQYLMNHSGQLDVMPDTQAKVYFHMFVSSAYFFPIVGGIIADIFWGKYRTILTLSIVYCLGHLALAIDDTRMGLSIGLTLIAIGSGGIKPCVSAHVGDQFTSANKHLVEKVFSYFYFAINAGAFISELCIPLILKNHGPHLAFGLPGILMLIATFVFWLGNKKYISIPPTNYKTYFKEARSTEGKKIILRLCLLYIFISVFWSLYDQNGSSWVQQATNPLMNKNVSLFGWHFTVLASQIQSVNAIMILILTPVFTFFIYPAINRFFPLNHLRKISIGLFIAALSFALISWIEVQLTNGVEMSVMWQVLAYVILTASEVMVSITALEFSYVAAPNSMKSFIMGLFLLSVSLGNVLSATVNELISNPDGTSKITGPEYFWFFTGLMTVTALIFIPVAKFYKGRTYLQDQSQAVADPYIAEG